MKYKRYRKNKRYMDQEILKSKKQLGLLMVLLILCHWGIRAQGTSINYTLSSPQVNVSGTPAIITSTLAKSGNVLRWTQIANGNTMVTDMQIGNTSGTWDPVTSQGGLTHLIIREGYTVSFILVGAPNGLSAQLSVQKAGEEQAQQYNFTITGITYP